MISEIDSKYCTIYVKDGTAAQLSAGSAVDGIQAAGQAEIAFETGGVAAAGLKVGDWLAPGSSLRPRYFITKIATDTVTVHKNLEEAIPDTTLIFASNPNMLEIELGEGNLTFSVKREREYKLSKGRLSHAKDGDEQPTELSVEAVWERITAITGGDPTVYEALLRLGEASAWVSCGGDCQPYSVDIVVVYEPDCASGSDPKETFIFPDFRPDNVDGDLDGGNLSMPGQSMVTEPITIRHA